jgi:hypothetical protein
LLLCLLLAWPLAAKKKRSPLRLLLLLPHLLLLPLLSRSLLTPLHLLLLLLPPQHLLHPQLLQSPPRSNSLG